MRSRTTSRGFTLVELMVVVIITVMILALLSMTFGGLQKSISISQRGLNDVAEGELILQVVQQDIRSKVSESLSSPVRYKVGDQWLDLFLCNTKGYQGERQVSLVGYGVEKQGKHFRLLRYARSIGWEDAFFGTTAVAGANALDGSSFRLTPDYLKNQGEELSTRVIDFSIYYRYWEEKTKTMWMSREPLKEEGYQLKGMMVGVVLSNIRELNIEGYEGIEATKIGKQAIRGGKATERLPWLQRFAQVDQALAKLSDKRVNSHHFFRTVEVAP